MRLKKVMPKVVEPPAHDHLPAGKGHYFADFRPVVLAVAVDVTVLAGRLRVQGAVAALQQGMFQERPAVGAEGDPLTEHPGQLRGEGDIRLLTVAGLAKDQDEFDQDPQVLLLLSGELFHEAILVEKVKERYDGGQKMTVLDCPKINNRVRICARFGRAD